MQSFVFCGRKSLPIVLCIRAGIPTAGAPTPCRPDVPVPHVPLLRTALTPAAACEPWNLELAELLGDAVLDHLAACYMYDFVK
jgi:hypothetical protein